MADVDATLMQRLDHESAENQRLLEAITTAQVITQMACLISRLQAMSSALAVAQDMYQ